MGPNDFASGKMNPFEFAKEIQQNRVADEDYIKVSDGGGIPGARNGLLSG